jgi:AcrR family transcriptional regulator
VSDERLEAILRAAYACFTRHGVRRTTMDDIAVEAGMSRPTVYQYVRNKEDAFRRLAERLFAQALADASAAALVDGTVAERLHGVLATKLELTLRLVRESPHATELLDASARQVGDLVEAYTAGVVDVATAVLAPVTGAADAREIAELSVALTRGLEADLTDPDLPRRRLRRGVALLAAGLPTQTGASP